ncbi:MAG: DNA adenine methylase [Candidatus Brocadiaceae bacterium]
MIPDDSIQRVAEWFFLNRSCFSADTVGGGFGGPSATGRNPCETFRNHIKNFDLTAERLRYVTVECLGFDECIRSYDSENSFFYCDPPYLSGNRRYYPEKFLIGDHRRLSEILKGVKGLCMISHYENGLYDELYSGWNRHEYQSYKVSRGNTGTNRTAERPKTVEVLYRNF